MSSVIKRHSNNRQQQVSFPPFFAPRTQVGSILETAKKTVLAGCALLTTAGIFYFCVCNRNEESWCVLKSNAQILSNMGLLADIFRP